MTSEERKMLLMEGNEEAFKRLAATMIKCVVTEYICKVRKGESSGHLLRYLNSKDFKFYCDMMDIEHSDIINSRMFKDRINKTKSKTITK